MLDGVMNAEATAGAAARLTRRDDEKMSLQSVPFWLCHLVCLGVFFVEFSWINVAICAALYYVRMSVGITAGYHRYFSHRTFKTSRAFQFVLALVGTLSAQKGVLWWAANHRHHHRYSDLDEDIHSPTLRGFWFSHVGWILCKRYEETRFDAIKDFASYPELRWLNKYFLVPPALLGVGMFLMGGFPLLIWGFFLSTVLLWHGTFTINSLSHVFGSRRYKTTDTSRNNFLLALITCGEGWHNNHHYHQNTANQGWFWWELDFSYYLLKALSWVGIVWDLRTPSDAVKLAHLKYSDEDRARLRAQPKTFGTFVPAKAGEKVLEALSAAAPAEAPVS
jgi:stearoyl-CoA desaturase (Delta-9 desaturase)